MLTTFQIALVFGALGVVLTLLSNLMKRMVPLRIFAVAANSVFLVHSLLERNWINTVLQVLLLVVNGYRLWDLHRLIASLEGATADTPIKDWLLPHMTKKIYKAGEVLFRKGDTAHQMIYIRKGTVVLEEIGQKMGAGSLVGEIGLFSQDRKRTVTITCETLCVCYTMTDEAIYLMYYQNPKLGFFLIRLIVQRLLQDLQRRPATAEA